MKRFPLAALAVLLSASAAVAEVIPFAQPKDGAQELAILASFFGERELVDLRTAIIDINSDNVSEVFARYQGAEDCTAEGACRTVGLRFVGDDWKVVFDSPAKSIETGAPGFGAIKALVVDGISWTWQSNAYAIDVSSAGVPVAFSAAPSESAELLVYQFGQGALELFRANQRVTIEISGAQLAGDSTQVVARLGGPGVCGRVMGCPIRVLNVVDGQYSVLLEGYASGDVIISGSDREGWKDIMTAMPNFGFAVYGWDGERYGVADMKIGSR